MENAASVASMLLTTDVLVVDKPEDDGTTSPATATRITAAQSTSTTGTKLGPDPQRVGAELCWRAGPQTAGASLLRRTVAKRSSSLWLPQMP